MVSIIKLLIKLKTKKEKQSIISFPWKKDDQNQLLVVLMINGNLFTLRCVESCQICTGCQYVSVMLILHIINVSSFMTGDCSFSYYIKEEKNLRNITENYGLGIVFWVGILI